MPKEGDNKYKHELQMKQKTQKKQQRKSMKAKADSLKGK